MSQIVELPHVEHLGKSRVSILGGLDLTYRFIAQAGGGGGARGGSAAIGQLGGSD